MEANSLDCLKEPIIELVLRPQDSDSIGRLAGFRRKKSNDDYDNEAIELGPSVHVVVRDRRGYLAAGPEDTLICLLTREGESDLAALIASNAIEKVFVQSLDSIERLSEKIELGYRSVRGFSVRFKLGLDTDFSVASTLWFVIPTTLYSTMFVNFLRYRDAAISARMEGLLGRVKHRLKDDMAGRQ